MTKYNAFIFDGEVNNTITTQDIAPEISIDLAYALKDSVRKLREALGVTSMRRMEKGSTITIYVSAGSSSHTDEPSSEDNGGTHTDSGGDSADTTASSSDESEG